MRRRFDDELEKLHNNLIRMGALCEDAIANAAKALLDGEKAFMEKTADLEHDINMLDREIEQMCVRLILHEQPVASDLRSVTAAQNMIIDMERIGDQALDISELSEFLKKSSVKNDIRIAEMAKSTISMVTESIDSFVEGDMEHAKAVIAHDEIVDSLFSEIKEELMERLIKDNSLAGECFDLLMIAKYFERIGDHAENIAEWVLYSVNGNRPDMKP